MSEQSPETSDCWNCGLTESPIFAKRLCLKCWRVDKIRNRFDPKPKAGPFKWTPKRLAALRYFRVGLGWKIKLIAAYLGTNVRQVKLAVKKYNVRIHSRGRIK